MKDEPRSTMYQVKILSHTRPDGLQHQINEWLHNRRTWIAHVCSIALSHTGSFHYAAILYSEWID